MMVEREIDAGNWRRKSDQGGIESKKFCQKHYYGFIRIATHRRGGYINFKPPCFF